MTAWRFVILSLLALFLVGAGTVLWLTPTPESTSEAITISDALLASSAASGIGLLLPQLVIAAPVNDSSPQGGGVLIALRENPTPVVVAIVITLTPTATSPARAARPTIALPTNTIALTRTPSTGTPLPTRTATTIATPTTPPGLSAQINGCGNITQLGNYSLATSLSSSGDCLNIRASNVTLDCGGLALNGSGFNGYGIAVRNVGFIIQQRPTNIEIRNCKVSGYRYGVFVEGSTSLYLHDNNISDNGTEVDGKRYGIFLGMAESGGIRLNNSQGARIDNNTTNDEAIGIDVRSSSGVLVRGNISSNNTAWGVNLLGATSSTVSGNTTAGNIRSCTWGAGVVGLGCDAGGIILQNGSSGNIISSNQVLGNNGNGIFIKAHGMPCGNNNTIANNTISGAMYNAVEIGFCSGNQILGNQIVGGLDGIWMGFSVNTTIRDNNIRDQRNHGIISNNSHDNTIANNTLYNDDQALYIYWEQVNPNNFWWLDTNQYRSFKNCICGNTITANSAVGIHLNNSTQNNVSNNTLDHNGHNYWIEGDTSGTTFTNNNPNNIYSWLGFPLVLALAPKPAPH